MAGIGFQLARMIDSGRGIIHALKSYGYAVTVVNGPMIMCIAAASIVHFILGSSALAGSDTGRVMMTITFSFVISGLLTSGIILVLTRYVSDCIYNEDYRKIMPSLYGSMVAAGTLSLLFTSALIAKTGMELEYAILVSALYSIVSIINIEMVYLSAVKNYRAIVRGFLIGNALAVILIFFLKFTAVSWTAKYVLLSFNMGFSVTTALLMYEISRLFGDGNSGFMEWTEYFFKYPSLVLINIFYYASLYFICFFYRFKDHAGFVKGFIVANPEIDIPFYCAVLGFIPGLVYFTVRFEPSLHLSCRQFLTTVANDGTYQEIEYKMNNLIMLVKGRYMRMISFVAIILLTMLLIPFVIVSANGTDYHNYLTYWLLVIALNATLLMYVSNVVLLYFDARTHSLIINSVYLASNIFLTILLDLNLVGLCGFGFMSASIISMLLGLVIMFNYLNNLKDHAFVMKF